MSFVFDAQSDEFTNFNDLTVDFNFSLKNSVTLSPLNFFNKKKNNLHINIFKNIFMFWSLKF